MEIYAKHFQIYSPVLTRTIEQLNKKALVRLVKLLVTFPLENDHLRAIGKGEKDAFHMADELLKSKYSMVLFTAFESIEKEKELAQAQKEAAEKMNETDTGGS